MWEQGKEAAPWRIAVGRTDGATCYGIQLSTANFITCKLLQYHRLLIISYINHFII